MAYLLDANTFIQAKNEYYWFDICPGFWEWLDRQNSAGNIFSIDRIGDELKQVMIRSRNGRPQKEIFLSAARQRRAPSDAASGQLGTKCRL